MFNTCVWGEMRELRWRGGFPRVNVKKSMVERTGSAVSFNVSCRTPEEGLTRSYFLPNPSVMEYLNRWCKCSVNPSRKELIQQ